MGMTESRDPRDWRNLISTPETASQQPALLTVSDVERLAKAGVKVDLEQIKDHVIADPPKTNILFGQYDPYGYIGDFLRRWDRAQPDGDPERSMLRAGPDKKYFEHVSIYRREQTFHVFVVMTGGKAGHLTDPCETFPSEALIAKCFLLLREGKGDAT